MKRRIFLSAVCAIAGAPLAFSQPVRRIAILEYGDKAARAESWRVLLARLRELGYAEGTNLAVERRWADNSDARVPALAQELLASRPEVILVNTTPGTQAVMRLTDKVPIVFTGSADPVASGLVASLARPGGNVTGFSQQLTDVNEKRLALLLEIVRGAKRIGFLGPASNAGIQVVHKRLQTVARPVAVEIRQIDASEPATITRAFEQLRAEPIDALLVASVLAPYNQLIVELAAKARIPASFIQKGILESGALVVFGPDLEAPYRHAAEYVHRIFGGTRPADLPVQQPTEFWLGVNLKTARTLGMTTIKVVEPDAALVELEGLLGFALR